MSLSPFVSVVIPNFNHAQYLEQRFYSVLNQTYQDFEVIIIDDKSTDNSLEIIRRFKDDPHVSHLVINEVNSGNPFEQWTKGISLSKGEVIWIAENDDWCDLNMLEKLVASFTKNKGCSIAYCNLSIVNENGIVIEQGKEGRNQYFSGTQYIKRYLCLANIIRNSSCAIFSRKIASSISGDYEFLKGAGDYLFWVNLALKGNVAIVNSPLCYFRRHSNSVTSRRDSDGTNFIEEKIVFDYILQNVHISWLRKQGALYYHWIRIINMEYDSNEIRMGLYQLWSIPFKYTLIQLVVKEIQGYVRTKFNIYL